MAPYSLDLRQKVVGAWERGMGSQRQIADVFGVSVSFVEKLLMQLRRTGQLAPKPHAGGKRPRLGEPARERMREWLQEQPDLTLAELAERLERELEVKVGLPWICRVLQAMGLPRKKSRFTPPNGTGQQSSKRARGISKKSPSCPSSGYDSSTSPGSISR